MTESQIWRTAYWFSTVMAGVAGCVWKGIRCDWRRARWCAMVWLSWSPQGSHAEILTPQNDGIRKREGLWELLRSWEQSPQEWAQHSYKRLQRGPSPLPPHGIVCGGASSEPGGGPSEGSHAHTLVLDFQPPELWETNPLWISHSVHGILLEQSERIKTWACLGQWKGAESWLVNVNILVVISYQL